MHTHVFPRISREEAAALDPQVGPWLRIDEAGQGMIMRGEQAFRPVIPPLWDAQARLADMDRQGVDMQIVCATPIMFGYALEARRVMPWAERMNDLTLAYCAAAPTRLKALAQVPLQDTELACREADHAMAAG
ncbi:MAG: amidohydrolase family protein, partial [Proteobacteria bacterium]|nr:amidohydrolase family protein [Pseudomonadota bacterium]